MQGLLRALETAWKLLRAIVAPLGIMVVFGALVFPREIVSWAFWVVAIVIFIIPVVLEWECALLTGALVMIIPWGLGVQAMTTSVAKRALCVGLLCCYVVYMAYLYERDLWARGSLGERFGGFPYRFATPAQRLTLLLKEGGDYVGSEDDLARLSYDRNRDIIRGIAARERSPDLRCAAFALLRYPEDADVLRDAATERTLERVRIAALGALPLPAEADLVARELATLPAYAHYPLELGWPHEHAFHLVDRQRDGDDRSYRETERYRCPCGMEKVVTSDVWVTETTDACPECGCTDWDMVWYGDYEWRYECSHCSYMGEICSYDYGVSKLDYHTKELGTEYRMVDAAAE